MLLKELVIQYFRCFLRYTLHINSRILFIEGNNGTGKTTILESLYYLCYLKSFRTRITNELIRDEDNHHDNNFFIKATLETSDLLTHELQVGFSQKKRSVRVNQKNVQSYKEIIDIYRVLSLTEDDIQLIKGGPDKRRSFIDQYILLHKPELTSLYKRYKKILEQRNALFLKKILSDDDYYLWTSQLWTVAKEIRQERINMLTRLEQRVNQLLQDYVDKDVVCGFKYTIKNDSMREASFDEFKERNHLLITQELYTRKSLIGSHLDDFFITWQQKSAKLYASRGQQKLLTVLMKIAQVQDIAQTTNSMPLFLLDDFVTDFDNQVVDKLVDLLISLHAQLIFTCPIEDSHLKQLLISHQAQMILLPPA